MFAHVSKPHEKSILESFLVSTEQVVEPLPAPAVWTAAGPGQLGSMEHHSRVCLCVSLLPRMACAFDPPLSQIRLEWKSHLLPLGKPVMTSSNFRLTTKDWCGLLKAKSCLLREEKLREALHPVGKK